MNMELRLCAVVPAGEREPEARLLRQLSLCRSQGWLGEVILAGGAKKARPGFRVLPPDGGSAVARGVAAAGDWDGCLLLPPDLGEMRDGSLHTLCMGFARDPGRIAVPLFGGRPGRMAVLPAALRPQLEALRRDQDLRPVLWARRREWIRVQVYDPGILRGGRGSGGGP